MNDVSTTVERLLQATVDSNVKVNKFNNVSELHQDPLLRSQPTSKLPSPKDTSPGPSLPGAVEVESMEPPQESTIIPEVVKQLPSSAAPTTAAPTASGSPKGSTNEDVSNSVLSDPYIMNTLSTILDKVNALDVNVKRIDSRMNTMDKAVARLTEQVNNVQFKMYMVMPALEQINDRQYDIARHVSTSQGSDKPSSPLFTSKGPNLARFSEESMERTDQVTVSDIEVAEDMLGRTYPGTRQTNRRESESDGDLSVLWSRFKSMGSRKNSKAIQNEEIVI